MTDKFDVIIVGAGPAGCSSAIHLSRLGYDVLMLEKGKVAGQKNVTGGVLFGKYLDKYGLINLIPNFEEEAPIERKITEHQVHILSNVKTENNINSYKIKSITDDSLLSKLGFINTKISTGVDYTVLRSKFDRWFSMKAIEEGALLNTENTVENLIFSGNNVVGVQTTNEQLYADLVIDSSGVTSNLIEQTGLRDKLEPMDTYHGVKHVYELDKETIDKRFKLKNNYGKSLVYFGEFMHGVNGGAFIYTNNTTISIGIVFSLDSLMSKMANNFDLIGKPVDILENFERQPIINEYIKDANLVEYSAHNIPKGHKVMLNQPYINGYMATGDCLGAFVKIGPLIDGMRRAIATGIMAGETFDYARKNNDYSINSLSKYKELLQPIYSDIDKSRLDSKLFENELAYTLTPKILFNFGSYNKIKCKIPKDNISTQNSITKIQNKTGILDYEEDSDYSHIKINQKNCDNTKDKLWVPLCPVNCYTLVNDKGVFASFKDLYQYNLKLIAAKQTINVENDAKQLTLEDMKKSKVNFDHVACVSCGTCGVIGPKSSIIFNHERSGHGVKFKYG